MTKYIIISFFLLGCKSEYDNKIKAGRDTVFDTETYSKIMFIGGSIQRQFSLLNEKLSDSTSKEVKAKLSSLDSISHKIDTIRDELIHYSEGFIPNTGGLMNPLTKEGVNHYFYQKNEFRDFAHNEFDQIIRCINKEFSDYLECSKGDIFQFTQLDFIKQQEPENLKPSDYLLKDKSQIEVLLILQYIKNQIEIIKFKLINKYVC